MVSVVERIWRRPAQSYLRPFAQQLDLRHRSLSKLLQRKVCDFGWDRSFVKASGRIREHYGFDLAPERIRASSLEHARRLDEQAFAEKPATVLNNGGVERLLTEADGLMIRLVKNGKDTKGARTRQVDWHECRLCAAQADGAVSTQYAASFSEVETLGTLWSRCAQRAGWGSETQIQTLGDGAVWIDRISEYCFGSTRWYLVDFFHVCEYLADAAEACALKETPERWRKRQALLLKKGKASKVIANLGKTLEPVETPEDKAPVRAAWRYLSNRIDKLDYPKAIRLGLPIGTGLIESANGHVIQDRLKGRGMAWLPKNAQAMAQARAFCASGRWEQYWEDENEIAA